MRGACDRPKCASSVVTHMNNQRHYKDFGPESGKWHEARKTLSPVAPRRCTWHLPPTCGMSRLRELLLCGVWCAAFTASRSSTLLQDLLFSSENMFRLRECGLCRWLPVVVRKIIFSLCFVLYCTPISVVVATQKGSRGCSCRWRCQSVSAPGATLRSSESWCAWKVLIARRVEVEVAVALGIAAPIGAHVGRTIWAQNSWVVSVIGSTSSAISDLSAHGDRICPSSSCQLKCGMCWRCSRWSRARSGQAHRRRMPDGSINDAAS